MTEKKDQGWEFLFMGADIDAWAVGSSIGITKSVNVDKMDMRGNLKKMSYYTASYRAGNNVSTDFFQMKDSDVEEKMNKLLKDNESNE